MLLDRGVGSGFELHSIFAFAFAFTFESCANICECNTRAIFPILFVSFIYTRHVHFFMPKITLFHVIHILCITNKSHSISITVVKNLNQDYDTFEFYSKRNSVWWSLFTPLHAQCSCLYIHISFVIMAQCTLYTFLFGEFLFLFLAHWTFAWRQMNSCNFINCSLEQHIYERKWHETIPSKSPFTMCSRESMVNERYLKSAI